MLSCNTLTVMTLFLSDIGTVRKMHANKACRNCFFFWMLPGAQMLSEKLAREGTYQSTNGRGFLSTLELIIDRV